MIKKLLGIIVLGLLWSNVGHSIEYCNEYNKTKKPLEPATFISVAFLKLELDCLGKNEEAKIFDKKQSILMEKMVKIQIQTSVDGGSNVPKKLKQLEQDYINSVVNLFYELK